MCEVRFQVVVGVVGQLLVGVHVQVEGGVVVSFCLKLQNCVLVCRPCVGSVLF